MHPVWMNSVIFVLCGITVIVGLVYIFGWPRSRTIPTVSTDPSIAVIIANSSRATEMTALQASELLERLRAELPSKRSDLFKREAPETQRLRELHDLFMHHPDRWDVLVTVGDVYRSGAYPRFRPCSFLAEQCYKLAAMCPDDEVAGMARSKFMQCRKDLIAADDIGTGRHTQDLPAHFAWAICSVGTDRVMNTPFRKRSQSKTKAQTSHAASTTAVAPLTAITVLSQPPIGYKADAQNVHDHGVTRAASASIARLRAVTQAPDKQLRGQALVDTVAASIVSREDLTLEERRAAVRTLDELKLKLHSTLNISEQDALALVWNRIHSDVHTEVRDDLVCTLGKQLATAVEDGQVVCSTGRITRILGALEGIDDEAVQAARPMWAVRQELAQLAGKVREVVLQSASLPEQEMYQAGTCEIVEARMRDMYRTRVHETYCRGLGMHEVILHPFIEENAAAF